MENEILISTFFKLHHSVTFLILILPKNLLRLLVQTHVYNQFHNSIETDTFVKIVLSDSGASKHRDLMITTSVKIIHMEPIPSRKIRMFKVFPGIKKNRTRSNEEYRYDF